MIFRTAVEHAKKHPGVSNLYFFPAGFLFNRFNSNSFLSSLNLSDMDYKFLSLLIFLLFYSINLPEAIVYPPFSLIQFLYKLQ